MEVEWIHKMWSIHTVEYSSAIKRNDALTQAAAWKDHENILSERNQVQRDKSYVVPFEGKFQGQQIHRDREWISGCQGLQEG